MKYWVEYINEHQDSTGKKIIVAAIRANNKKYIGRAVCLPEDVYNYEFGAELALRRALHKMIKDRRKHLELLYYVEWGVHMERLANKYKAIVNRENNSMLDMINLVEHKYPSHQ